MRRFTHGENRTQVTLLPESLDDYVDINPMRVVDVFVCELYLGKLGLKVFHGFIRLD